jgi:hypothetical protein
MRNSWQIERNIEGNSKGNESVIRYDDKKMLKYLVKKSTHISLSNCKIEIRKYYQSAISCRENHPLRNNISVLITQTVYMITLHCTNHGVCRNTGSQRTLIHLTVWIEFNTRMSDRAV